MAMEKWLWKPITSFIDKNIFVHLGGSMTIFSSLTNGIFAPTFFPITTDIHMQFSTAFRFIRNFLSECHVSSQTIFS